MGRHLHRGWKVTFELGLNNEETGKGIEAEGTAPTKPRRPGGCDTIWGRCDMAGKSVGSSGGG